MCSLLILNYVVKQPQRSLACYTHSKVTIVKTLESIIDWDISQLYICHQKEQQNYQQLSKDHMDKPLMILLIPCLELLVYQ